MPFQLCYSEFTVEDLFDFLALAQVATGLYLLWQGIVWLTYVRRRLNTDPGFYAPRTAVICPCRGLEPGLERNLVSLCEFDHQNYEVFFVLASESDPAHSIVKRVAGTSRVKAHVLIAGKPENCSEKVNNLRFAVEHLPEEFEVLVFTDSDGRPGKNWLHRLVAPLTDSRIGATTTMRWFLPNDNGLPSALLAAWNASVVTMLGPHNKNFCWGGGTAIRRKTFDDANVLEAWSGAASDDFALTNALAATGRLIVFCPECLAATPHPWTGSSLIEFTNRQVLIARIYSPRRWLLGAGANLSYSITLLYAAVVILNTMIDGDPWLQLALMTLVMILLATAKGALRTVAVSEMLPEWKAQLNQWAWVWTALAPIVPFLFSWNFIASLLTRRIRWRNIRYELVSPNITRVLTRSAIDRL